MRTMGERELSIISAISVIVKDVPESFKDDFIGWTTTSGGIEFNINKNEIGLIDYCCDFETTLAFNGICKLYGCELEYLTQTQTTNSKLQ